MIWSSHKTSTMNSCTYCFIVLAVTSQLYAVQVHLYASVCCISIADDQHSSSLGAGSFHWLSLRGLSLLLISIMEHIENGQITHFYLCHIAVLSTHVMTNTIINLLMDNN